MDQIVFVAFVIAASLAFARLEIEIEGPNGWAANLPTWRIKNRWTKLLLGSRPLTGYHLWVHIFVLVMIHFPAALHISAWSWALELRIASFYILFFIVEDFMWFVLNPAFGLKRFRREHIWWHGPAWWWIMPRDYWVLVLIGSGTYALSLRMG